MPGKYFDYYNHMSDRILPFLAGRHVAIEQRFPGSSQIVYRRHSGRQKGDDWIRIDDAKALSDWAFQYAEAFHANLRSEEGGAWFVIDIDSRGLPLEMGRLAAVRAADVLSEQRLIPLVTFSGADGFHLMWDVPDLKGISDDQLWELERAVVRAVACEVERRLVVDPAASAIRAAVGEGHSMIATGSADRENADAILFDEYILKDNANFRVPYSVHPRTGLVAAPISKEGLPNFVASQAQPEKVAADSVAFELPRYRLDDVEKALMAWQANGC
jgi:hypothetical protein